MNRSTDQPSTDQRESVTRLRPSCRRACGGHAVAGALLSRAADLQIETPGEPFQRTLAEWVDDLHGLVGEKKIRAALSQLIRAGFLEQMRDGKVRSYTVSLAKVERATGGLVGRTADVSRSDPGHMADVEEGDPGHMADISDRPRPYGRRETPDPGHMADVEGGPRPYGRDEGPDPGHMADVDSSDSARAYTGARPLSLSSGEVQEEEGESGDLDEIYQQIAAAWRGANERPLNAPNVFYQKCDGDAQTARRILSDARAAAEAGSTRDLFWFLKDWSPDYRPPKPAAAAGSSSGGSYADDPEWVADVQRTAERMGIR